MDQAQRQGKLVSHSCCPSLLLPRSCCNFALTHDASGKSWDSCSYTTGCTPGPARHDSDCCAAHHFPQSRALVVVRPSYFCGPLSKPRSCRCWATWSPADQAISRWDKKGVLLTQCLPVESATGVHILRRNLPACVQSTACRALTPAALFLQAAYTFLVVVRLVNENG